MDYEHDDRDHTGHNQVIPGGHIVRYGVECNKSPSVVHSYLWFFVGSGANQCMVISKERVSRWVMYIGILGLFGALFMSNPLRHPYATGFYLLLFAQYPALQMWQGHHSVESRGQRSSDT